MRVRDENKICKVRQYTVSLIVEEGLDGFSMNKLAKAAGISPATLYIYYKDKDDLITKVSTEIAQEMVRESLKDFDPDMHFAAGLQLQWQNRSRYFVKYPLEVEFIEKIRYSNVYQKIQPIIKQPFKEILGKFVKNAIEKKELIDLPLEVYWSIAFAPLYQLIKFHTQRNPIGDEPFQLNEDHLKQTLQLVLKALQPS
ncbi:TetR family transcriptional regulator [Chitinophaga caeni]|uniref:TetR family transcriptional regulator n=1 Tax=Chitinophaga caeni TaxID=2029983 RepID=A0A291QTV8_9BACT|nr:TetR/AcrR family transcriptional regulator [Chitinophaga caeni]ATL47400.1 TetR family transcriptional regulator [Chitinophaga caeni]